MLINVNCLFVVLLCMTIECYGHLGLLDIVGGVHDRIHSTAEKVAGGILGGLNVNFQGHVGVTGQRYPNRPQPQPQQGQTIVVVVEENSDHHEGNGNHPMTPNQYGHGSYNNQYNNNQNRPGYNQGQWNGNPNANQPNHYGQQENGQNYGNHNNYGNYGGPDRYPDQGQNNYQQRPDQTEQGHQNQYGNGGSNGGQPNVQFTQQPQNNGEENHYGQQTTPHQEESRPTFGSVHEEPTPKPVKEKNTEKDEPLFVPLNPNEYVYGGDKITINAPKRQVEGEKDKDEDQDLPIDIRFQDE